MSRAGKVRAQDGVVARAGSSQWTCACAESTDCKSSLGKGKRNFSSSSLELSSGEGTFHLHPCAPRVEGLIVDHDIVAAVVSGNS